jgi:CDP-diacylglycerol pyrophosphatase
VHFESASILFTDFKGFTTNQMKELKTSKGFPYWELRLGINSGPIVKKAAILLIAIAIHCSPHRSRDILWKIVSTCVARESADDCSHCDTPREDSPCGQNRRCEESISVWNESKDFVALRDIKMCGCPASFIHGLALPRSRVTGVEDTGKPDGIWNFAWDVARKRIANESEIALVVNPARARSQDQLHVHILRLRTGHPFPLKNTTVTKSLDLVWAAARIKATQMGLDDYGILVTQNPDKTFLILIDPASPEAKYTRWRCRGTP